jgi:hypothetical protein
MAAWSAEAGEQPDAADGAGPGWGAAADPGVIQTEERLT